jgi:ribonuclease Z
MRRAAGGGRRRRRGRPTARAPVRPRQRPQPERPRTVAPGPPRLSFACLGTSGAVPSADRDTTALVVRAGETVCLVDVGGSPVQKLRRVGVDPLELTAVVVTHTHPDHVYGLPALIQCLPLLGRRAPLPVYCRVEHVELLSRLLGLFGLGAPGELPVPVIGVEPREGAPVLTTADLAMTASPNAHGRMPNLAVRVDVDGRSLVYSSDTRPCPAVATLARGVSVLVHEATFATPDPTQWHSTARQAGEVARQAGAGRLLLAHVGYAHHRALAAHVAEARAAFDGPVGVAAELAWYRA